MSKTQRTVVDWSWEQTDSGLVGFHGYNEDGDVVVKRWFHLESTEMLTDSDEWEEVADDGGWSKGATFLKHDQW